MKTDYTLRVWVAVVTLISVTYSAKTDGSSKDHPIYKYGYVVSHKEGGSQAHVETRNGNMTLGRYYVNFPNGSGQKVTYLADDVGFHTGVVYSSQTKKGSSKTRIAMGHKALATLENLEGTQPTPKTNSPNAYGIKSTPLPVTTVTVKPEKDLSNYTFTKGFYLVRQPIETVTSNQLEPASLSPTTDSDVQQSSAILQQTTTGSNIGNFRIQSKQRKQSQQELETSLQQLNTYLPTLQQQFQQQQQQQYQQQQQQQYQQQKQQQYQQQQQQQFQQQQQQQFQQQQQQQFQQQQQQRINHHRGVLRHHSNDRIPMYTNDKSIEKTVLTDLDAQLISKIQKHADGIIMNDLKKKPVARVLSQQYSYSAKPETKLATMQPIVVTAAEDVKKTSELEPNVKKFNKNVQSETVNVLRTKEKENSSTDDQISKTSEVAVNVTKPVNQFSDLKAMNRNSDSANFTLCESNLCVQDSNRAFSNSLVSIKPRPDIALGADIPSGRKSPTNFYPKNQLKHEMHYVTTIDVQKGISLDVQQNEDGSIRLANNFPFNKLPNYQRPLHPPTAAPILSNSITSAQYPSTPNIHFTSNKSYLTSTVTSAPELYDVTPYKPIVQNNANGQVQEHHQGNVEVVYQLPQPISSGITHITTNQADNLLKPTNNHKIPQMTQVSQAPELPQPHTGIVFINHQSPSQVEQQRKQNFVEEERKEYFENLKKVEQITQQNSPTPQPEISINSNGLTEEATPAPLLAIENNSVKPAAGDVEQQVHYVPEVHTANYQNDVSNYAQEVPVTYPTVQQVQTPVVYQKPTFAYAPQYVSAETEAPTGYYEPQHVQNVFIDNSLQTSQNIDKDDLTPYTFTQPTEAEERVQQVQHLTLPQERINPISVEPSILRQQKGHRLDKTLLLNPLMTVDYGRVLRVEQPVPVLSTYPMQLQSGSELSSIYQLPQEYQLSLPVQLPPTQSVPAPFPPPSFSTPVSPGQYHVTMSVKPTPNKLRIQPLKPSPPAEDETRMESIRNLLSQPQFNPTYFYAGFPTMNRLQLRHIGRKKQPNFDQVAAQSLTRRDKSLKNLKIEYGFKPPLRPSVEFSEEVKPSIYGPSVPLR